ncbi:putative IQ motif, EF-hand binding protein [Plasmopara halstedii]
MLRKTLPDWAHARSKRALKQLDRIKSKAQPQLTLKSTSNFDSDRSSFDFTSDDDRMLYEQFEQSPAFFVKIESQKKSHLIKAGEELVFQPSNRWKSFEVDAQTSILYGILTNETSELAASNMNVNSTSLYHLKEEKGAQNDAPELRNMAAFRLIVFLDAFQQFETLETFFQPLLLKFPRGKILLCGFPTRSKRHITWNNAQFASVYLSLLEHVMMETREWLVEPKMDRAAMPQYLIGFGTGASTALQFLGMELPMRQARSADHGALTCFTRSLRGLVLINAVVKISDVERRTLRSLQKRFEAGESVHKLDSDTAMQLRDTLASLPFSSHYRLHMPPSRSAAIETCFCKQRNDLDRTDTCALPTPVDTRATDGLLPVLLHGTIKNRDVSAAIANLAAVVSEPFALILIHGSQNALFGPHQIQLMTEATNESSSENFLHVQTVSEALNLDNATRGSPGQYSRCLHVTWLKGGHELLQEQSSFFHNFFYQLASAATARSQPISFREKQSQTGCEEKFCHLRPPPDSDRDKKIQLKDSLVPEQEIKSARIPKTQCIKASSKVRQSISEHLMNNSIQQEFFDWDIERAGSSVIIHEHKNQTHCVDEEQVPPQTPRLMEQRDRREAMKDFHCDFEQMNFVSSSVEIYRLDAPPVYERFDDIASGAQALAKDLKQCYKTKALHLQVIAERRLELNELSSGPLAAMELEIRNLKRIFTKAQSTGMIAKADLGTVRILPITSIEMQTLGRELNSKRNTLKRMQSNATQLCQDVEWNDQLLQRVSVIIQRNERFRQILLPKLCLCADMGNERALSLREEYERHISQRNKLIGLLDNLKRRQENVRAEYERAQATSTFFFDTNLRVVGVPQRVQRTILVQEVKAEKKLLPKRIDDLVEKEQEAQSAVNSSKVAMEEVATRTKFVEETRRTLESICEVKSLDTDKKTHGKISNLKLQHYSGETVRLKKHTNRSLEERQWVAFDFLLNFAFYQKHVAPEEIEIIQNHADYQQKIDKKLNVDDLQRLMQLPARNCLAFCFFKTPEEMKAHYLLRKYTFGDGEDYFAQLDHDFIAPDKVAGPSATISSSLKDMCSMLQISADTLSLHGPWNPSARTALLSENLLQQTLLHVPQTQILPHKNTTYSFQLPKESQGVAVVALTVSIVFQGQFKSTDYQNGRLSAMMYMLPPVSSPSSLQQRYQASIPIGKCFHVDDLTLNSPHCMGRLVLRHEPQRIPLSAAATYQIVIGAPILTNYSLEVCGRTALFADEALRRKRIDALKKQALLPRMQDEVQDLFVTIQLSERKQRLARRLATELKEQAREAELDLLRKIECDNDEPLLGHEERWELQKAIQAATKTFTVCCFLYTKRDEEVRDIEQSLCDLIKTHEGIVKECKQMEILLSEYRANLPRLAALLSIDLAAGDTAAAKLAKELNTEYMTRNGTKSAKVRWAELSAMKSIIPFMMSSAEQLRRKYKRGEDTLSKKEREWILLDRILHPHLYQWEQEKQNPIDGANTNSPCVKLWLHGEYPTLSNSEKVLASMSSMEIKAIMETPWNMLERKEIPIRKILTQFRGDSRGSSMYKTASSESIATLLRAQNSTELTHEEQEWRLYDQLLNPKYYSRDCEMTAKVVPTSRCQENVTISPKLTRKDLLIAINTPVKESYKLPKNLLRARTLLLRYDPQKITKTTLATQVRPQIQELQTAIVNLNLDAQCRVVFHELQRALANTHNKDMDSHVLHSTPQRFPTNILCLELEKKLDRLLISQIKENDDMELASFLSKQDLNRDEVSDSDSDDEAIIAREEEARRKAKENAKKEPKFRGKMLGQISLQKQRREIKNALQKRSIDEQRWIQRERKLGTGGCTACWTNPCQWKPFLENSYATIQARIDVIYKELERVKHYSDKILTSNVCMAALKSGDQTITMHKSDLINELTSEVKLLEKNLRLKSVDEELHEAFSSKKQFFETQALHGFHQTQDKNKVQRALQHEHNALVAHLTAYEVIEDILESMLEGWMFGERVSKRQVLGYIPSLKLESPLTMHDLRRFEQDHRILHACQNLCDEQLQSARGLPLEKWKPIEVEAIRINVTKRVIQNGLEIDKSLTETENALKFGIFCMTLMYFRGLSLLRKQRSFWSVSGTKLQYVVDSLQKSAERRRMDIEEKNVELRARKAAYYDMKARNGQARKQKFYEQKLAAYRKRLVEEYCTAKSQKKAAIDIQRVYRGGLGRIAVKKKMIRRREMNDQRALEHAAASTLQRVFRGRLGRIAAEDRREELAESDLQVSTEEEIAEEEEYWRMHKFELLGRQVATFVRKVA